MPRPRPAPITSTRYALEGRIVTMNSADEVLSRGTIYIDAGRIAAVSPTGTPAPTGFENAPVVKTGGTIYPGLIELHNHLSYNVLRLWDVPKSYTNRDQWGGTPVYRKLISGPMTVLGKTPGYVEAVVRYVECKCLLSGVTTSQGIALFSNAGITRYYRGVVRNAEAPDHPQLPAASSRIADVEATDANKFLERLQTSSCLLLHLSEGIDEKAREHFEALQIAEGNWAITPALAGIHCIALNGDDFQALQKQGGAMIWSPLSNLLLYGKTADIQAAKQHGVLIGIGSDWSPSGSKNLLGELKVARVVSAALGGVFGDLELVAMATRNAAAILKWEQVLGSIEAGKLADLVVIAGRSGDPYAHLLESSETGITLVVINGVPRYGRTSLMKRFGARTEDWKVGRAGRVLNLAQQEADPVVGALTLGAAQARLKDGLRRLPELALALEHPGPGLLGPEAAPQWSLMLDHEESEGIALRPHLPFGPLGTLTAEMSFAAAPPVPLSQIVEPLELDPLTVADDDSLLERLSIQRNLPDLIKQGLRNLYLQH